MIITNTMIVLAVLVIMIVLIIRYRLTSPPDRVERVTAEMSDEEIVFHLVKEGIAARGRFNLCGTSLMVQASILAALLISNGVNGQLFISKSGYSYEPTFIFLALISLVIMIYINGVLKKMVTIKDLLRSIDNGTGMVDDVIDKKIKEYESKYK